MCMCMNRAQRYACDNRTLMIISLVLLLPRSRCHHHYEVHMLVYISGHLTSGHDMSGHLISCHHMLGHHMSGHHMSGRRSHVMSSHVRSSLVMLSHVRSSQSSHVITC